MGLKARDWQTKPIPLLTSPLKGEEFRHLAFLCQLNVTTLPPIDFARFAKRI